MFLENITSTFHIIFGTLAVLAGGIALCSKKGRSLHIRYGKVFVWSMMFASLLGILLGVQNHQELFISALAGVLTITLIISSVLTLRPNGRIIEFSVASVNVLSFIVIFSSGYLAMKNTNGVLFEFNAEDYFFLSGMSLLVLCGDINYYFFNKSKKILRHLWRMCLAFFIAAGSAFTGPGMAAFPESIQKSGILFLPELLIFLLMIYWVIKYQFFSKSIKVR